MILVYVPPGNTADPSLASIVTVTGSRVTRSRVTHIVKLPTSSSTVSSGRSKITVTTVCVRGGWVGVMCVCVCEEGAGGDVCVCVCV